MADRAVLLLGPSGAGKSALALRLISFGAQLVADDQTILRKQDEHLIAEAPQPLLGMIEARGIGILKTTPAPPTRVFFAVDLSVLETQRLPHAHVYQMLGVEVPCLHRIAHPHFADTILFCLREGIIPGA